MDLAACETEGVSMRAGACGDMSGSANIHLKIQKKMAHSYSEKSPLLFWLFLCSV